MILGIDCSLSSTGWSIFKDGEVIALGKICTAKKTKGDNPLEEDNRMTEITKQIIQICQKYGIKDTVMEGQFANPRNLKTGLQLSRLRGAIMMGLRIYGVSVEYIQPSEVKKKLTGNGNCPKETVAEKVIELHGDNDLVKGLGEFTDKSGKAKNSDIYDSIAICTAYSI